jgi:hypothetical protein
MTPGSAAQVVALLLRSSGKVLAPLPAWPQEQDFAHMLNRVLPDTVRALGWADVPQDFHARCDAEFPTCQMDAACMTSTRPTAVGDEESWLSR